MAELIRQWVLGLAGAALCCAVLTEITPKGGVKTVVRALCGMVMALALVSPFLRSDGELYALNMAKYREKALEISSRSREISDRLSRTIIEEECRAYILDKAALLGADVDEAAVKLKWSSQGFWYPVECSLTGEYSAGLEAAIAAELGIEPDMQEWVGNENS